MTQTREDGAHIVTLTRDDKGSLSIYDPQINKRIEGTRAVRAYLMRYVSPTYGLFMLTTKLFGWKFYAV